jgi:hypothetical protein
MPGSVQHGNPRPDDPSLEFQPYGLGFFLNGDLQHTMMYGNRETKVKAVTGDAVSLRQCGAYHFLVDFGARLLGERDEKTKTINRPGD